MMRLLTRFVLILSFSLLSTLSFASHQGCCSWHGGISGCDENAGRLVCRDGTYSPSCTCDEENDTPLWMLNKQLKPKVDSPKKPNQIISSLNIA